MLLEQNKIIFYMFPKHFKIKRILGTVFVNRARIGVRPNLARNRNLSPPVQSANLGKTFRTNISSNAVKLKKIRCQIAYGLYSRTLRVTTNDLIKKVHFWRRSHISMRRPLLYKQLLLFWHTLTYFFIGKKVRIQPISFHLVNYQNLEIKGNFGKK